MKKMVLLLQICFLTFIFLKYDYVMAETLQKNDCIFIGNITTNRDFYYGEYASNNDFTINGNFYDETGKSPKITHKFNTPWNINFKVKVSYKWISNTKYQLISVKNTLKPDLEYYSIGKKVVLFNTTKWLFTKATWDLWDNAIWENKDYFVYDLYLWML